MNTTEALQAGIEYGFLDSSIIADGHFKPTLLVNDPDRGEKVLTSIISELVTCDESFFSVAFITEGGVETIEEFNRLFYIATPVNDAFIEEYRKIYVKNRQLEKESEKAFVLQGHWQHSFHGHPERQQPSLGGRLHFLHHPDLVQRQHSFADCA